MTWRTRGLAMWVPALLTAALLAGACSDSQRSAFEDGAEDVRSEIRTSWSSLRTDAERLVDDVQTNDAPRVKQDLLARCRDLEEDLRADNSSLTDDVASLCNTIRDANPQDSEAWERIQQKIEALDVRFSGQ